MVSFLAKVKIFSDFGQKPWTIIRRFDRHEKVQYSPMFLAKKVSNRIQNTIRYHQKGHLERSGMAQILVS